MRASRLAPAPTRTEPGVEVGLEHGVEPGEVDHDASAALRRVAVRAGQAACHHGAPVGGRRRQDPVDVLTRAHRGEVCHRSVPSVPIP